MKSRIRGILDGAALGGTIGFAVGSLLEGLTLVIPGGRALKIARAVAVVVPKTISVSGKAVGTIAGAAIGAKKAQ